MTVSVIVPFTDDGAERSAHWAWLRRRLEACHPGWEIVEAPGPYPWAKGPAIDAGVARADGDVLVVMDADVLVPACALEQSVRAARTFPWVVPHQTVHRLTAGDTEALVAGPPIDELAKIPTSLARPAHRGVAGGGLVVLTRAAYDLVGPPDARFVGWGGEDTSWRRALDTLLGEHLRCSAPMVHLWHRPQPEQQAPDQRSRVLARRYKAAQRKPDAMRALITEEGARWPTPASSGS